MNSRTRPLRFFVLKSDMGSHAITLFVLVGDFQVNRTRLTNGLLEVTMVASRVGAGCARVLGLATRVPTRHVTASKLGSATLSSYPWVREGGFWLGNGSGRLGNDLLRSRWVRPWFV